MWIVSWDPFLMKKLLKMKLGYASASNMSQMRHKYNDMLQVTVPRKNREIWLLWICLDWAYCCWNWKYCSKISFKCVNSIVGPIFNKKVTEKWNLWDPWTVHICTVYSWQSQLLRAEKKKKKREKRRGKRQRHFHCNPNGHYIWVTDIGWRSWLITTGLSWFLHD